MTKIYYSYDPEKFHFIGQVFLEEGDEVPANSTELPVPICDGERYPQWNGQAWIVKHLVDGVWVDCTDELPLSPTEVKQVIPAIEGETNGEQI